MKNKLIIEDTKIIDVLLRESSNKNNCIKIIIRRVKYDIHKIPSPPSYPIIGHLHHFINFDKPKFSTWIYEWYQKLGQPPVMIMDTMFFKTIIVNDSSFVHEKMISHNGYDKAKSTYDDFIYLFDENRPAYSIATTPKINPKWKAIRKAILPSFSKEGLKQKFPIILSCINTFEEIVLNQNKEKIFEAQSSFSMLALDIIMLSGFEYKIDAYNKGEQLIKDTSKSLLNILLKRSLYIIKLISQMFPKSSFAKKYKGTLCSVRTIADDVLLSFKNKNENYEDNNLSIISNLSKVIDPETGKKLSDFEIIVEIVGFITAGYISTGCQLSWIFIILTLYPECEHKILQELKEHNLIGNNTQKIEFNDLAKLKYLNAFVKECLRIAPATDFTGDRELPHDEIICGYRLPKGMIIAILSRTYNMTNSIWENPHEFIPERWFSDNSSYFEKNLMTFSSGPRACPGMQFAYTEILTTFICLISKYEIKFINKEKKSLFELMNETFSIGIMTHEKGLFFEYATRN